MFTNYSFNEFYKALEAMEKKSDIGWKGFCRNLIKALGNWVDEEEEKGKALINNWDFHFK
jgi:hypothetical protein